MARSPLVGAVGVLLGYMAVRSVVYWALPTGSMEAWFVRDCWMTIPRAAALASLLLLDRFVWHRFPFDIGLRAYQRPALYGSLLLAIELVYLSGHTGEEWPLHIKLVELATTPVVGLFEEYAFRGIALEMLLAGHSVPIAVLTSSLAFTGYHFEAQPFNVWPLIFLIGVVLANLRVSGVSIFWLAAIHTAVDTIVFFFDNPNDYSLRSSNTLMFLAGLCLLSIATYRNGRRTPPEP